MRLAVSIVALALSLSACSTAADQAEQEYQIVSNDSLASDADKCVAARKVAQAYLSAKDEKNYQMWHLTEISVC